MLLKTLRDDSCRSEIVQRIQHLSPDSPRQWGKMTVNEMVCHLTDCFHMAVGQRKVDFSNSLWHRTGLKWIALYLPLPAVKGFPTFAELDPQRGGTRPDELAADLERLQQALTAFLEAVGKGQCADDHPMLGSMSKAQWLRWGYMHTDHHLRQFGV